MEGPEQWLVSCLPSPARPADCDAEGSQGPEDEGGGFGDDRIGVEARLYRRGLEAVVRDQRGRITTTAAHVINSAGTAHSVAGTLLETTFDRRRMPGKGFLAKWGTSIVGVEGKAELVGGFLHGLESGVVWVECLAGCHCRQVSSLRFEIPRSRSSRIGMSGGFPVETAAQLSPDPPLSRFFCANPPSL